MVHSRSRPSVPPWCAALGILATSSMLWGSEPATRTIELRPKPLREFEITLPAERFVPVAGGFSIPHQGGERFRVVSEGDRLRVDLDGDGTPEATVEGTAGFVTLTGLSPAKNAVTYSARLKHEAGQPWTYSCGSAMVGEVDGTRLQVFDQNLNGKFSDVGEDALIVGNDTVASFLSSVISVGGKLYGLEVADDGSRLTLSDRAEGPAAHSGTLDLVSKFTCKAKLDAVVVVSTDGRLSFSLAKAKDGLRIPAAEYRIHSGRIALGSSTASIGAGRSSPIVVENDKTTTLEWGGPVSAEFAAVRSGQDVGFTPWDIWYYGKSGEEYFNFLPLGKSPGFRIANRQSKEEILWVRFPGNC